VLIRTEMWSRCAAAFIPNLCELLTVSQLIKSLDGTFVLSDDSHGPATVGLNYDRLESYVKEMNITRLARLERTKESNAAGRFVSPAAYEA
jgi:histidinol-phosphatase (PHP family)